jgi:predicted Rossmann fold flavoprotein
MVLYTGPYIRTAMQQNGSSSGTGPKRVVVVGGGPAGLLAAGTAASLGAQATILEKMDRPGRKLSLAGCGRRVLTNLAPLEHYLGAYGPNGKFLHPALLNFSSIDLAAFVESLGVSIEVERSGRFLATEDQMTALTTALTKWAAEKGVNILTDSAAMNLQVENGKISGVLVSTKKTVPAESVVLATGGRSYPETGSTGDGYTLAEAVGHRIVPTRPALVPLETKGDVASRLQGLSLHDVATRLLINDHCEDDLVGDVTFTSFGLSGSVILHLSRQAVDALQTGGKVEIGLDLVTAMDERTLEARLVSSFNDKNDSALHNIVEDLLPPKLTAVVLEAVDLSGNTIGAQVTPAERRRLRHVLKDFRLRVTGHRPWDEAIVTAGGVSLDEVDPQTMQSRLVKGLYFAGEVLDIDGPAGGYNLQAAFSTGRLAGQSAATDI